MEEKVIKKILFHCFQAGREREREKRKVRFSFDSGLWFWWKMKGISGGVSSFWRA